MHEQEKKVKVLPGKVRPSLIITTAYMAISLGAPLLTRTTSGTDDP
jgi:hypothetical protein